MGGGISADHRHISLLIADMKTQAEPEAVRQRQPVINNITDIDGRFLLGQIARNDMAAIRCNIKPDMRRPRTAAAVKH